MRPARRARTPQRRVFIRVFWRDRSNGRPADARTLHDVRTWDVVFQPCAEARGLGQAGPAHAGTGFRDSCALLQLWDFQSDAGVQTTGRSKETFLRKK